MSGWSKDPVSGKPKFIPEKDASNVSLYSESDVKLQANASRGIRSPGWVSYKEHARANGHTARRVETLVSFRNVSRGSVPVDPTDPIVRSAATASIGLNGLSDWTPASPFLDVFKTARIWIGHTAAGWGTYQFNDLETDANGWLLSVPEDATAVEALILTDIPEEMTEAQGSYVVTWEGTGILNATGAARNVTSISPNQLTFDFTPRVGDLVGITITETSPTDHIRNITVVKQEHVAAHSRGEIFNPLWLDTIRGFRCLRFMDWQATNNSPITSWAQRTVPSFASWARQEAPVEVMVRLANELEADAWFCIPHMADDNYARFFATYVRDNLNPNLTAYFEYSNEVWNFMFGQTQWMIAQAEALFGPDNGDGWMQVAGAKAAHVADIVASVYGSRTNFKRVTGVQTGWLGLEEPFLKAPRFIELNPGTAEPSLSFDCYAVTGYFDGEMSQVDKMQDVRDWIAASTPGTFDVAITNAIANIRTGGANSLVNLYANWDYHKNVADTYGYDFIMYEGGTHTIVPEAFWEEFREFYTALNYSPEMAEVYRDVMDHWEMIGGISFNVFVEITYPSRHGFWGGLKYLGDDTVKWDTIRERTVTV